MEIKKELKKIPEGCIEIPLEEVDYIYQSSQSHTPVIVMKQKLPPMQSRVLECMRCGSKKNLNTNKDKSFVECDECMWGNDKSEKQEEWREIDKDIRYEIGGKRYVSINGEEYVRTKDISKLLSERQQKGWMEGFDEGTSVEKELSKLLKEKE